VAEALIRRGMQLSVVDNLDDFYALSRKRLNLQEIRNAGSYAFFEADVRDMDALRKIAVQVQPEVVIHLAARAGVRPSIEQPALYESVNVGGTVNVLEIAREFKVQRMIFGSSSSVYGITNAVPFCEDDLMTRPISPYAATKLAAESMCYTYTHLYGLTILCLRFFTVYGPRQRPDLAIHKFTALIESGKSIPVYGDGSMGRDYTYVDDIVAGVVASLEYTPELPNWKKQPAKRRFRNGYPINRETFPLPGLISIRQSEFSAIHRRYPWNKGCGTLLPGIARPSR